jgi:hypothetical protein
MREVDDLLRAQPRLKRIVYEAHPELAFARMNGGKPVLAKKRKPDGYAERCRLLAEHGFACSVDRLSGAARDDILDAIAVCRTALLIAQGKADVGYADSGAAISGASKGGPIKIIAVINQANSYGLVSLADSGIKTPQDLVGKKIAVCPGCAQVPLLDAFMAVQHLDPSKVEIQNVQESPSPAC